MAAGFVGFAITWRADVFSGAPQSSSAADFGTLGINFRARKALNEDEWAEALAPRDVSAELDRPAAQDALLREIAEVTGGTYLGAAEELPRDLPLAEPRIVRVDRRADVELWSRPMLFFLALLFLGAEWGLRQRSGYL